jgi:hypothetical protein
MFAESSPAAQDADLHHSRSERAEASQPRVVGALERGVVEVLARRRVSEDDLALGWRTVGPAHEDDELTASGGGELFVLVRCQRALCACGSLGTASRAVAGGSSAIVLALAVTSRAAGTLSAARIRRAGDAPQA